MTVFAGGIAIQRTNWAIWFWQLGSCIIAIFFVYFMCPETVGKTCTSTFVEAKNAKPASILADTHAQWRKST